MIADLLVGVRIDWQITTAAIVFILILAVIIFSILRPASRITFGVFFERKINGSKEKPDGE